MPTAQKGEEREIVRSGPARYMEGSVLAQVRPLFQRVAAGVRMESPSTQPIRSQSGSSRCKSQTWPAPRSVWACQSETRSVRVQLPESRFRALVSPGRDGGGPCNQGLPSAVADDPGFYPLDISAHDAISLGRSCHDVIVVWPQAAGEWSVRAHREAVILWPQESDTVPCDSYSWP